MYEGVHNRHQLQPTLLKMVINDAAEFVEMTRKTKHGQDGQINMLPYDMQGALTLHRRLQERELRVRYG